MIILSALLLALGVSSALAADVFRFAEKEISLFEGETATPALTREGDPAQGGDLTYSSGNKKAVSVSADGVITAGEKGISTVKATLRSGKRVWTATVRVNVLRRVTNVTLDRSKLSVYRPEDEAVSALLRKDTAHEVLVVPAGKSLELKITCTPKDASNRKVTLSSSDEGVLSVRGNSIRALQSGECELVIASQQNPEINETYHVLVTQPAKKLTITGESRVVNAGENLFLDLIWEPADTSIQRAEWSSRNPRVATVDLNGVVTGVKKGQAIIEARALDGSGRTAGYTVTVAQKPTGVALRETSLNIVAGQGAQLHASVQPLEANERGVVWSSSDPSIATVNSLGHVTAVKRGECTITATSKGNSAASASATVRVIQRVKKVEFTGGNVSLPVRTTAQLTWNVEPEDADIKEVTFTTNNKRIATVDENGVVTGVSRGTATITATATDGSNRRGQTRVTVIQPVEGVSIQYGVYHVQLDGSLNVKAIIEPRNANNQNVNWSTEDEYVATVRDRKNIGTVYGRHTGVTTITGVTEDGGYSASAVIRVADFNRAIIADDLYLDHERIRIVLRNRSDFTVDRVYFTIETFDADGKPLVCNADGVSNFFEGAYRLNIYPGSQSEHYQFSFGDYVEPAQPIGSMNLVITGWRDLEGYTRNIPESERPSMSFRRWLPTSTPEPSPTPAPTPAP